MIEIGENLLQIDVTVVCLFVSVGRAVRTRGNAWILLSAFYGCWVLGDLYWVTFLILFESTPAYRYVPDFSWYSSYLLLFLLLRQLLPQYSRRISGVLPWVGAVFAAGMCVFYMQWGSILSNLICAVLMSMLLLGSISGLTRLRGGDRGRYGPICSAVLLICLTEYIAWTVSCFWEGDSFANPYFYADTLVTLSFVPFLFAVRRAVRD